MHGLGIRLATDFSGLETPSMAMALLNLPSSLVSACEAEHHLRTFIQENFQPLKLTGDVFVRAPTPCDLYIAGPPCVRFSNLGLRKGEPEARNSTLDQSVDSSNE